MNDDTDVVTVAIPRSALTIVERARMVSQKTSERVLGLPKREFLAELRAFARAGGHVSHVGKLRLVDVEEFASYLGRRPMPEPRTTPAPAPNDDDELDALARELGASLDDEPPSQPRPVRSSRSAPRGGANRPESVSHDGRRHD